MENQFEIAQSEKHAWLWDMSRERERETERIWNKKGIAK